jgi:hypothetical protein
MTNLILTLLLTAPTGINTNQIRTAQPNTLNASGVSVAEGNSIGLARADHQHGISGTLQQVHGGTGSGSVTCPAGQVLTSTGGVVSCTSAGISTYTRATVPTCDAAQVSKEILVHDTGQADETWVCELRDATYIWATYSQAPNSTAQVMANGTEFVTVGCSTWTGTTCTATAVGPASSMLYSLSADNHTLYITLAIGSTAPFTEVDIVGGSGRTHAAWGMQVYGTPAIDFGANGGGTSDYNPATDPQLGWPVQYTAWKPGMSSNCAFVTTLPSTTGFFNSQLIPAWSGAYWSYKWDPFNRSGTFKFTPQAAWVKGWNGHCQVPTALPTPTGFPTGKVAADYYWLTFSTMYYQSQMKLSSGNPTIWHATGPDYAPFTIKAVAVR